MLQFSKHYKHFLASLYFLFYLAAFFLIERLITTDYTVIHCSLDDKIPFVEYFIIPYLLWFLFFIVVYLYLGFTNKREYYQYFFLLAIGMTLFIIVSVIFPNGQNLRPEIDPDKNIFTAMVASIYKTDTSTNIFPSIHVYNAVVAQYAIMHNKQISRPWKISGFILTVLICLATVFLKQHSVIDGIGGIVMAVVLVYFLYYFKPVVRRFAKIPAYVAPFHRPGKSVPSADFM
ncbi:MAG TPA: phosphatase PAP2 family protein [Candidatus Fimimorpha excrementavium]|nr:phosphatase PAP2 family protein [Candidatus Fimimorpha excrementavium]